MEIGFIVLLVLVLCVSAGADQLFTLPADVSENVPQEFSRFYFANHEEDSRLLGDMLQHFFFSHGYDASMFNKEFLSTGEMWLAGTESKNGIHAQEMYRRHLLAAQIDGDGAVSSHPGMGEDFGHEQGWPFPNWSDSVLKGDSFKGNTMGWHFQTSGKWYVWSSIDIQKDKEKYFGDAMVDTWETENLKSFGIQSGAWKLEPTGASPIITSPLTDFDSFQAPFLELRWSRSGCPKESARPYIEWMRMEDREFSLDRRVYFDLSQADSMVRSMITMYRHPKWTGHIKRLRIGLAPGESNVKINVEALFTCYDTRHVSNGPIFINSCWEYFRWTGDTGFLRENMGRMRAVLEYLQTEMCAIELNRIRNTMPGHDGIAAWVRKPDGSVELLSGHGIGSNYWDILPIGWDDMYATSQYYLSLLAMADLEEAIKENPGWNIPRSGAFDPKALRKHAADVKKEANKLFWNEKTGRFVACIDKNGKAHDYGYTFVNLNAIWYGIASDEHARQIMDWLTGRRIVEGDTSTGADIYHWRFCPRATTKRNLDWYIQGWNEPEKNPWGYQIQDGGGVLGFSYYDLMSRLQILGPDDVWNRLTEILAWERDVRKAGGYRKFYESGKDGTMQGGGPGGLGIDCEFYESVMLPTIVTSGFLGLNPTATGLEIDPNLPKACPEMGIQNVLYHGVRLDVKASDDKIEIHVKNKPLNPIYIALDGKWALGSTTGSAFTIIDTGTYTFIEK